MKFILKSTYLTKSECSIVGHNLPGQRGKSPECVACGMTCPYCFIGYNF